MSETADGPAADPTDRRLGALRADAAAGFVLIGLASSFKLPNTGPRRDDSDEAAIAVN
jgi:hypothetical protein